MTSNKNTKKSGKLDRAKLILIIAVSFLIPLVLAILVVGTFGFLWFKFLEFYMLNS